MRTGDTYYFVWQERGSDGMGAFAVCSDLDEAKRIIEIVQVTLGDTFKVATVKDGDVIEALWALEEASDD